MLAAAAGIYWINGVLSRVAKLRRLALRGFAQLREQRLVKLADVAVTRNARVDRVTFPA